MEILGYAFINLVYFLIIILGVIFIIIGLSPKKEHNPYLYPVPLPKPEGTPVNKDSYPMSPGMLGEDFYKQQILELRGKPKILSAFLVVLKSCFISPMDRKLFKDLEKFSNQIKTLSTARADAMLEMIRSRNAQLELQFSMSEEYMEQVKDIMILRKEAEKACLEADIREANKRGIT